MQTSSRKRQPHLVSGSAQRPSKATRVVAATKGSAHPSLEEDFLRLLHSLPPGCVPVGPLVSGSREAQLCPAQLSACWVRLALARRAEALVAQGPAAWAEPLLRAAEVLLGGARVAGDAVRPTGPGWRAWVCLEQETHARLVAASHEARRLARQARPEGAVHALEVEARLRPVHATASSSAAAASAARAEAWTGWANRAATMADGGPVHTTCERLWDTGSDLTPEGVLGPVPAWRAVCPAPGRRRRRQACAACARRAAGGPCECTAEAAVLDTLKWSGRPVLVPWPETGGCLVQAAHEVTLSAQVAAAAMGPARCKDRLALTVAIPGSHEGTLGTLGLHLSIGSGAVPGLEVEVEAELAVEAVAAIACDAELATRLAEVAHALTSIVARVADTLQTQALPGFGGNEE